MACVCYEGGEYHILRYTIETEGDQCLMPMSTSSSITIHVSPFGEPLGLDYFVSPVLPNGFCPPPSETSKYYPVHNTTVLVKSPRSPPAYVLPSAVELSARLISL